MTCNNCVSHVQKALQGTPGVSKAVVNLKKERAEVECSPGTSPQSLVAAVAAAGYGARESAPGDKVPAWKFWQK
jgi:copper chaperone CopZ